jgi:hypothetical protein
VSYQMIGRFIIAILILFYLCATSPALSTQDDLESIKNDWENKHYSEVLPKLLAYKKGVGKDKNDFEIDYMIATSLCNVPKVAKQGCQYFMWMTITYNLY